MRKFSISMLLFVITGILYSQAVPEMMYYRFHNNTATTTPNFASAPVGTNPTPLVATDAFGSGGQFDSCLVGNGGTAGCINTNWATAMGTNWTISFWIGAGQVDNNPSYLWGDINAAAFRCFYGGAAGVNNILVRGGFADILITGVNPTATVVTLSVSGATCTVYKNGVLFNTFPMIAVSGAGPFKIGGYGTGASISFSGKLDEFRMYNRALSASEVAATWNIELGLSAPLCEQFAAATFPPTGWTEIFSGTNYWSRVTQSGFGLGTGSALYDMWDAPTGTAQQLRTLQFTPSIAGDSLFMDDAFQPFGAPDSLIISTSTDNGTTWVSFRRLGNSQLGTTTGNPSPFVPTATQWAKRIYGPLPVGTNKLEFNGKSGFGDNLYIDSICIGQRVISGITNNNGLVPVTYSLAQNFPNPFNPTTQISFGLPKSGNVKLVVFDVLGREVKTLVNEFRTAGTYRITFDASSLSSGAYFYTITANDFTATKKMLLVK